VVIVHEDQLFRDEFHTNDTTFIRLLSQYDVLLFVRTDHRRYVCTKSSDRKALLEKMVASRNYLDDHVLSRMNGNQERTYISVSSIRPATNGRCMKRYPAAVGI